MFDDDQLTYAELNRAVAPGVVGVKRGGYLLDGQGVVRRLGLEAWVSSQGEVFNARRPRPHTGARVLVALSLWEEPSGVDVLEGLGCRTPVVASRAGGIRDLIAAGRTGRPVSTNDPLALAAAIERAPIELDPQESTAGSGPRVVAGRHTWRSEGEHLLPGCEGVHARHETSIG